MQGSGSRIARQGGFSLADGISLMRLPLALGFVLVDGVPIRIGILALAAMSDLGDGWVARRWGGSRIGALLDPIADKLFMVTAFAVVLWSGALTWYEVAAVLIRDLVATIAFAITVARGQQTSVSARAGGKVVTALQLLTVLLCLLESPFRTKVAWLTAGAALYAIYDYHRPFFRKLGTS